MNIEELKKKNLLHLEDVYKFYGSKLILDNVDMSVAHGELCTLVGPSGCGKSTLLRLILGQEQATSGMVLVEGGDISVPNRERGIVYQKYSLFPHLTVLDNILLGKQLELGWWERRKKKNELKEEGCYFLKRIGLEEHADKYPYELSGGMQQRVAIAQALIMKPKILLMDEAFGALDPTSRESMQLFLLELWEELKMTVFFVTHSLEEALFLGTRVLVLSQYYSDGREEKDPHCARGAKVVADYLLPKSALSTRVKEHPDFIALMNQIRKEGFDPTYLKKVTEFNLKHPDSFQTLTPEERG
jgi:NitT/TauT family transport system ATP-binding protein